MNNKWCHRNKKGHRDYFICQQWVNIEGIDKLLETYNLPRLKKLNLNRPITRKKFKSVIKNIPTKKGKH